MKKTIDKIIAIINGNIENMNITKEKADEELSLIGMDSIKFIQIMVTFPICQVFFASFLKSFMNFLSC